MPEALEEATREKCMEHWVELDTEAMRFEVPFDFDEAEEFDLFGDTYLPGEATPGSPVGILNRTTATFGQAHAAEEIEKCYWNKWHALKQHGQACDDVSAWSAFDHYIQCGMEKGLQWGCGDNAYNYRQLQETSVHHGEQCRRLGCCIFVLDMGLDSTAIAMHNSDIDGFRSGYDKSAYDWQNGQEYHLHVGLRDSDYRTMRAMEADAVFVASYDTFGCLSTKKNCYHPPCQRTWRAGCNQTKLDIQTMMSSSLWKARGGDNFVFTAGHPNSWRNPEIYGKGIKLLVDTERTDPGRSHVVIPYMFKPSTSQTSLRHRKLFFSSGHCRGGVRESLLKDFMTLPDRSDVDIFCNHCDGVRSVPDELFEPSKYQDALGSSQFCLCLRGDTISARRDLEVAELGCIPVYVGRDLFTLPLSSKIPYQDFALFFPSNVTATEILRVIDNMGHKEQDLRRQRMSQVLPNADLRSRQGVAAVAESICATAA